MEFGFFHPVAGYWQTITQVTPELFQTYPEGTVEVPIKPGAGYEWDGTVWVAPAPPDPVVALNTWRAKAKCTRKQGILAIGESRWASVLNYRNTATWAEKVVIDDSPMWYRNSQDIQFFGYLLGLNDTEMDNLFLQVEEQELAEVIP